LSSSQKESQEQNEFLEEGEEEGNTKAHTNARETDMNAPRSGTLTTDNHRIAYEPPQG